MKILAFGVPELIMFAVVLVAVIAIIVLLVVKIKKGGNSNKAYQRIAQLDDLRKRGTITEDEYQQRKQDAMKNL